MNHRIPEELIEFIKESLLLFMQSVPWLPGLQSPALSDWKRECTGILSRAVLTM